MSPANPQSSQEREFALGRFAEGVQLFLIWVEVPHDDAFRIHLHMGESIRFTRIRPALGLLNGVEVGASATRPDK